MDVKVRLGLGDFSFIFRNGERRIAKSFLKGGNKVRRLDFYVRSLDFITPSS